jgi:hypothetical protein
VFSEGDFGNIHVLGLIVLVHSLRRLPPSSRNLNRCNLLLEPARLSRSNSLLITPNAVVVLLLPVEAMVISALLALETHVLLLIRVGKTILEHAIDERLVSKFGADSQVGQVVGGVGHGLGAAGDDDVRVASYDRLGTEDQGFDRGCTHFVYSGCDRGLGETGAEGDLAGGVLSEAGNSVRIRRRKRVPGFKGLFLLRREHIAHEDLLDIFGLEASTLNGSCSRISNL